PACHAVTVYTPGASPCSDRSTSVAPSTSSTRAVAPVTDMNRSFIGPLISSSASITTTPLVGLGHSRSSPLSPFISLSIAVETGSSAKGDPPLFIECFQYVAASGLPDGSAAFETSEYPSPSASTGQGESSEKVN